jgi:type 1 fimbria pilin
MLKKLNNWLVISIFSIPMYSFAADDNRQTTIRIYGEILGPTCKIKDDDLFVEFGTLTNKDLLWHGRSSSRDFAIEFECTAKDNYNVAISFTGQETFYNDLQRLIIIEGDTPANPWGIAIQLVEPNGENMPLNAETATYQIKDQTALNFKAFVKVSQSAINSRSIRLGEFNAIANFLVEYQ